MKRATAIALCAVMGALAFCTNCGGEKHTLVFVEGKRATCTEAGYLAHWLCTECGGQFSSEDAKERISVDLPPLQHHYERRETLPTCLEDGKAEKVCTNCGDVILLETYTAQGHDFGDYETVTPPKCYGEGLERRTCKNCTEYEERAIPQIGHHTFDRENLCTVCGMRVKGTEGLRYRLLAEHGREIGYEAEGGTFDSDTVVLPCFYETLPVIRIGDGAFRDSNLREFVSYAAYTEIGESAFRDCINLREINLPESLSGIGFAAFRGCSDLRTIELPDAVTVIGAEAFYGCGRVTRLALGKNVSTIGNSAFWNMAKLNEIEVDEDNPNYSGEGDCLIETATGILLRGSNHSIIPEGVKELGDYAFSGCETLRSVTIPASVSRIGDFCFLECNRLAEIYFDGTAADWEQIEKGKDWDKYTADGLQIVFLK